jgi:putative membrane protein
LPVITVLGLSALWEIIEAWVTRMVHPELGPAYLGAQGDVWDAQKDMAAAMYGSLLCMGILISFRILQDFCRSRSTEPIGVEEREALSQVPRSSS